MKSEKAKRSEKHHHHHRATTPHAGTLRAKSPTKPSQSETAAVSPNAAPQPAEPKPEDKENGTLGGDRPHVPPRHKKQPAIVTRRAAASKPSTPAPPPPSYRSMALEHPFRC